MNLFQHSIKFKFEDSMTKEVSVSNAYILFSREPQLYKRVSRLVYRLVCWQVRRSICPSVMLFFSAGRDNTLLVAYYIRGRPKLILQRSAGSDYLGTYHQYQKVISNTVKPYNNGFKGIKHYYPLLPKFNIANNENERINVKQLGKICYIEIFFARIHYTCSNLESKN